MVSRGVAEGQTPALVRNTRDNRATRLRLDDDGSLHRAEMNLTEIVNGARGVEAMSEGPAGLDAAVERVRATERGAFGHGVIVAAFPVPREAVTDIDRGARRGERIIDDPDVLAVEGFGGR